MMADKIRISAKSLPWLIAIDEQVRRYGGKHMEHVAADILDGWATRKELDDLIRRRLLAVVPYFDNMDCPFSRDGCGGHWSVDLTPRAVQLWARPTGVSK